LKYCGVSPECGSSINCLLQLKLKKVIAASGIDLYMLDLIVIKIKM